MRKQLILPNRITYILNRIMVDIPMDILFDRSKPIFLMMKRGGHTSIQNWMRGAFYNERRIRYEFTEDGQIRKPIKGNPIQPYDLRSGLFSRPEIGYLTNEVGFLKHTRNRKIIIITRSPRLVYPSLLTLYVNNKKFGYSKRKAKKLAQKYLNRWTTILTKLKERSTQDETRISIYRAEDIFKEPLDNITSIFSSIRVNIQKESIKKALMDVNECRSKIAKNEYPYHERLSFTEKSLRLDAEDECFERKIMRSYIWKELYPNLEKTKQ